MLQRVLDAIHPLIGAEQLSLWLLDPDTDRFFLCLTRNDVSWERWVGALGGGRAVAACKPFASPNAACPWWPHSWRATSPSTATWSTSGWVGDGLPSLSWRPLVADARAVQDVSKSRYEVREQYRKAQVKEDEIIPALCTPVCDALGAVRPLAPRRHER
jgi:hypothetical protein